MKKQAYKLLIILTLLAVCNSCQTLMNVFYGSNKKITYTSKRVYLEQNFQNKPIDTAKICFLQKEVFRQLLNEMVSKDLSMYYGVSGKYFYSSDQQNIKSCSGQFETLYAKVGTNDAELNKTDAGANSILQSLNLNPEKKTALFIFSYKFGRLSNSKIFDVIKSLEEDNQFDYRLISIDNSDIK